MHWTMKRTFKKSTLFETLKKMLAWENMVTVSGIYRFLRLFQFVDLEQRSKFLKETLLFLFLLAWNQVKKMLQMEQKMLANKIRFRANKKCPRNFFVLNRTKYATKGTENVRKAICGHLQPSMALSKLLWSCMAFSWSWLLNSLFVVLCRFLWSCGKIWIWFDFYGLFSRSSIQIHLVLFFYWGFFSVIPSQPRVIQESWTPTFNNYESYLHIYLSCDAISLSLFSCCAAPSRARSCSSAHLLLF